MTVSVKSRGVSLLLIVVAIVLFLLAALGIDEKWSIRLVPFGLAFFAGAFIFD